MPSRRSGRNTRTRKWALFLPVGGIYLLPDGTLKMTFYGSKAKFDWSDTWRLIFQIDSLAEDAKEWWAEPADTPEEKKGKEAEEQAPKQKQPKRPGWLRWMSRRVGGSQNPAEERRRHTMRAYGLATWLMSGVKEEDARSHKKSRVGLPPPSPTYEKFLANYKGELRAAQAKFRKAAQRTAQSRYWQGAMVGTVLLAILSAIVGGAFLIFGTEAAYGVAVPTGGLGAMVSLLQRMSAGKLRLDFEAGRDLLEVFGAVRPLIGAVFGLAVMALLLGEFIPGVTVPAGNRLAYFAALGFLAGFNERWARDMLNTSAGGIGSGSGEHPDAPAPTV